MFLIIWTNPNSIEIYKHAHKSFHFLLGLYIFLSTYSFHISWSAAWVVVLSHKKLQCLKLGNLCFKQEHFKGPFSSDISLSLESSHLNIAFMVKDVSVYV